MPTTRLTNRKPRSYPKTKVAETNKPTRCTRSACLVVPKTNLLLNLSFLFEAFRNAKGKIQVAGAYFYFLEIEGSRGAFRAALLAYHVGSEAKRQIGAGGLLKIGVGHR